METEIESEFEDIFPDVHYEAPEPPSKKFLPWHLPRKQYVRKHQWCRLIFELLHSLPEKGRCLRYMGLPGVDLMDLRYFYDEICKSDGLPFSFLGFNSAAKPGTEDQIELEISLQEVRGLEHVDSASEVLDADFSKIADKKSLSWSRLEAFGECDVVNLDLCDGFFSEPPGGLRSDYYKAVSQLLTHQSFRRKPWLLFLTTRTDSANIDADVFDKLVDTYQSNIVDHPKFREKSVEVLGLDISGIPSSSFEERQRLRVFLVGLSKWLIGMAMNQNPSVRVDVESVMGYSVTGLEGEDLVSLAFKFTPTLAPVKDLLGMAGPAAAQLNEGKLAIQALQKVSGIQNLDKLLLENENDAKTMLVEMEGLLAISRYDCTKYKEWVEGRLTSSRGAGVC